MGVKRLDSVEVDLNDCVFIVAMMKDGSVYIQAPPDAEEVVALKLIEITQKLLEE